jgi:hypothetical protein
MPNRVRARATKVTDTEEVTPVGAATGRVLYINVQLPLSHAPVPGSRALPRTLQRDTLRTDANS